MRAILLLPLLLLGCAAGSACPAGTSATTFAELAFGRSVRGEPRVTEADWAAFLAEEVTPRFPDGLTAWDAAGQWRGRDGRVGREATKLLWIALPGEGMAGAAARVGPVVEAYRARFGQESVLRAFRTGCVGF